MATSNYFLDADWRSNTDTPYITYGDKAFKNVYEQDWLSNHSYLFYNGGSTSKNTYNHTDINKSFYKKIDSPYLYSYLPSYQKSYIQTPYSSFKILIPTILKGGNNNNKNELKDRDLHSGEPLLYKSKEVVGPNPCFQPYRYSNNAAIDSTFLSTIDKNLPPVNYYPYGGSVINNNIKKNPLNRLKKNKKKSKINKVHKRTEKKALNKRLTRKKNQK